ncbi:uncharacterized protein TRIADDRAFT_52208 [Trichoplax adhaerens]|uniref:tRNA-dihydrouridine synthase n=1 Tax=Trichoplax adhaerens TaxID=10228 RepID=B3RM25_TRIAD|nr:hypothetical protein TRIADDRAFT_52208 [Trichoplax adhaerens]EDV29625.1 hypothetical protein TRIADDRAFT_52208 [Trichoplax adhaerens]|eukprot:XP_002108827.1 hypothetical protein TRIADDRAFT_52208 [Trichoplax adhaerens]
MQAENIVVELLKSNKLVYMSAPMVRYSKLPFRSLVRKYGCDVAFTPMIISESFIKSEKARASEFTTVASDRPLIVQFAASNAFDLADATELIVPYADGVDLNCGCPQRWAMHEGYGAHLINHPELVKEMVRHTRSKICNENFSISIKIRIHNDINTTVDLCRKAEAAGVSWITVHGRTTSEKHTPVHYDAIKTIKDSVSIPVIANGNVFTVDDAQEIYDKTNVDGVMSARGILRNPALYAGYSKTPICCVEDFVRITSELETHFTPFHRHLIFMLEKITCKSDREFFCSLRSKDEVLNYLHDHHQILLE